METPLSGTYLDETKHQKKPVYDRMSFAFIKHFSMFLEDQFAGTYVIPLFLVVISFILVFQLPSIELSFSLPPVALFAISGRPKY